MTAKLKTSFFRLTQVLVDEDDPAFKNPTKPIGNFILRKKPSSYGENR